MLLVYDEKQGRFFWQPACISLGWRFTIIDSRQFPSLTQPRRLERHIATDEVFFVAQGILCVGIAASPHDSIVWHTLHPGEGINIPRSMWHTTYATGSAVYAILEAPDTNEENTETRPII